MVWRQNITIEASPGKPQQSPEDAAMKDGVFRENNTSPPDEERVLPLFNLKHKTAIVSGAGAGIGLQVARGLAEAGANVAILYHGNKEAIKRAEEISQEFNVKCQAYASDLTSYEPTASLIAQIVAEFSHRLDIFVANAGIPWTDGGMIDGPVSSYHEVISTDLDSVYFCARAAGEVFRRQYLDLQQQKQQQHPHHHHHHHHGAAGGGEENAAAAAAAAPGWENYRYGSFIATASMSGRIVNVPQLQAAYNAAKAGVAHLCKSLSVEWVRFARVNSVSPGYMATGEFRSGVSMPAGVGVRGEREWLTVRACTIRDIGFHPPRDQEDLEIKDTHGARVGVSARRVVTGC